MVDEIELKFEVKNYNKMVNKILSLGQFVSSAREETIMYDNSEKDLFKRDERLRLRKIINLKNGKESCECSYKKPKTREYIKVEEEYEVMISSFGEMRTILAKIGFNEVSSYQRIRDTFKIDGVKITLDSFPFGDFLEIEGDIEKIKNIANSLGFKLDDNITESCDDIYARLRIAEGKPIHSHIKFEEDIILEKIKHRNFLIQ